MEELPIFRVVYDGQGYRTEYNVIGAQVPYLLGVLEVAKKKLIEKLADEADFNFFDATLAEK